jgi:hypothetical protein
MRDILDAIWSNNPGKVNKLLEKKLFELARERSDLLKLRIVSEIFNEPDDDLEITESYNVVQRGRTKTIRVRIRKNKIQRMKRFSAQKGFVIRGGKMVRMSPIEHRNRVISARKSKVKRRGHLQVALRKRMISLRRRQAMGL